MERNKFTLVVKGIPTHFFNIIDNRARNEFYKNVFYSLKIFNKLSHGILYAEITLKYI